MQLKHQVHLIYIYIKKKLDLSMKQDHKTIAVVSLSPCHVGRWESNSKTLPSIFLQHHDHTPNQITDTSNQQP